MSTISTNLYSSVTNPKANSQVNNNQAAAIDPAIAQDKLGAIKHRVHPGCNATHFSLDAFFEEPLQDILAILSHINASVFTPADCGINLETMRSYVSNGLMDLPAVPTTHDIGSSMLLSFKEKVWLQIIDQMERFGFSGETLLKVKENLFSPVGIKDVFALITSSPKSASQAVDMLQRSPLSASDMAGVEAMLRESDKSLSASHSLFDLLLVQSIAVKQESSLMILSCGTVLPIMDEMLLLDERIGLLKMQPHLRISLNGYILEYVSKVPKESYMSAFNLSSEELEVIRQLRSGFYKEVKVEFKQSSLAAIEMVQDKTIAKCESFSLDKMLQSDKYHKVNYTSNHQRGGYLQRVYRKKFTSKGPKQ